MSCLGLIQPILVLSLPLNIFGIAGLLAEKMFVIDKKYDSELRNKVGSFKIETGTKKAIFITLITSLGLKTNAYSGNVQNDLKMDVLFELFNYQTSN